jgi:hypothetical protein
MSKLLFSKYSPGPGVLLLFVVLNLSPTPNVVYVRLLLLLILNGVTLRFVIGVLDVSSLI